MQVETPGEVLPASDVADVKQQQPAAETKVETPEAQASQETPEEAKAEEAKQPPKWAQKRINELTRDKYRERARAEMLEERLAQIESRLNQAPAETPGEFTHAQQPQPRIDHNQIRSEVEQRVAFDMKSNDAFSKGASEFKDFETKLDTLKSVGVDEKALRVIVDSDMPHKVLYHLGSNPDEAADILSLPPVQMARAIGKLEARLSAPKSPPKTSTAPDPVTPVSARSAGSAEPSDRDDMKTWLQKRQAKIGARGR